MWLCMWKSIISEEILIRFLDYFNIFALCEQFWKIRILGPLLRQKGSPLGPPFAKNWVPFGSPFYNFWVPLRFGNSGSWLDVFVFEREWPGPCWKQLGAGSQAEQPVEGGQVQDQQVSKTSLSIKIIFIHDLK